ncbi:MAG: DUF7601 domain-containing protein [Anaerovoracaceae bacterium]|jgi:uncharacterized repeat protein (TIGR02543 family)
MKMKKTAIILLAGILIITMSQPMTLSWALSESQAPAKQNVSNKTQTETVKNAIEPKDARESSDKTTGSTKKTSESLDKTSKKDSGSEEGEAFSQSKTLGDVTVDVNAPAGGFPEGSSLHVKKLSKTTLKEDQSLIGGTITQPDKSKVVSQYNERNAASEAESGYDIYVTDPEGKKIDPEGKATVTFRSSKLKKELSSCSVYHIHNDKAEKLHARRSSDSLKVKTDSFSHYILTDSEGSKSDTWGWDAYYVGENDRRDVTKSDDFSLKYQVEFHNSITLKQGAVKITLPKTLFKLRSGKSVDPSDISVPQITKSEAFEKNFKTSNESTPFNYYEDGDDLVFINYKEIPTGSNTAFQLLYKNIDVFYVKDGTTWKIDPAIEVDTSAEGEPENIEKIEVAPLNGKVDTQVHLVALTKEAYYAPGKRYTPGLYTEKQVKRNIRTYASGMSDADIDVEKYKYVIWKVTARWRGNQPAKMTGIEVPSMTDPESSGCKVIGYSEIESTGENNSFTLMSSSQKTIEKKEFYVVTAYPADQVESGKTIMKNELDFTLKPYDGVDEEENKTVSDQWTYQDYQWTYSGDIIGVDKWNSDYTDETEKKNKNYASAGEILKEKVKKGEDYGSFSFTTDAHCNGFGMTHNITAGSSGIKDLGTYIPGTSYKMTAVDDAVYLYSDKEAASEAHLLTQKDYYFSSVKVTRNDYDYDPTEDERVDAIHPEGIDQTMTIYARFAGSDEWEEVGTCAFEDSGSCTYTFTEEQIARKPYRVKAEYQSVNYRTDCYINVQVRLRGDSETVKNLAETSDSFHLENVGGVAGEHCSDGSVIEGSWFQDTSIEHGNYSEPGIEEFTRNLYGTILMRDNANKHLKPMTRHAAGQKSGVIENDPENSRTLVHYKLSAYEGYNVYGEEGVEYLKEIGHSLPNRDGMYFYDLLPYGVKYESNDAPTAGRILDYYNNEEYSVSASGVTVDDVNVTANWRGTGRQMVRFHIKYDGAESAVWFRKHWASGYQLNFTGYYNWSDKDLNVNDGDFKNRNIAAYMDDKEDTLYGTDDEICFDNGKEADGETELKSPYNDFAGGDLNGNGVTNKRSVLYLNTVAGEDIAVSAKDQIMKKVRTDENAASPYTKTAYVSGGKGYSYDINVTTVNGLKNLIVFDRLENPYNEYDTNDPFSSLWSDGSKPEHWTGTLSSVNVNALKARGIDAVVYYCKDPDVDLGEANGALSGDAADADKLLEKGNWIKASEYEGDLAEVKAVAVDMRKTTSGSDFELGEGKSVSFQIHMTAPTEGIEKGLSTYNNASFFSTSTNTNTTSRVVSDTTRTTIGLPSTYIVEKEFNDPSKVPSFWKEHKFLFTATVDGHPLSNRDYSLETRTADGEWIDDESLHATGYDGTFTLKAGQRAVFHNLTTAERSAVEVKEEDNPFWDVKYTDLQDIDGSSPDQEKTTLATNTYRPVLFVKKNVEGENSTDRVFTFQVTKNGRPVTGRTFWYVKSARTDGGVPEKDLTKGDVVGGETTGESKTDSNGQFKLKEGEIVALLCDEVREDYTITEVDTTEDYINPYASQTVTTTTNGVVASFTNYYKWKKLYLTKKVDGQSRTDADGHEFTFQLLDSEGNPVTTQNEWAIVDEDGNESSEEGRYGRLSSDGKFTAPIGNRRIVIKHLAGGKEYTIKELLTGENKEIYTAENGGEQTFRIPAQSEKKSITMTNIYVKRPIEISKQVVSMDEEALVNAKTKEFTFTVKVNGKLLKDTEYVIYDENGDPEPDSYRTDENGQLTIKAGQKAVVKNAGYDGDSYEVTETPTSGYPQLVPKDQKAATGTIHLDRTAQARFVNGTPGALILKKNVKNDVTDEDFGPYHFSLRFSKDGGSWSYDHELSGVKSFDGKHLKEIGTVDSENISVKSGEYLLIPVSAGTKYLLTERSSDQVVKAGDSWYHIYRTIPESDDVEALIDEKPVVEFTNTVEKLDEKSVIYKKVQGLEYPKQGDILRFRIQRYTGSGWAPANDVKYYLRWLNDADNTYEASDLRQTEEDGTLDLVMEKGNEIPQIVFPEEVVKYNPSDPTEGTLRITEIGGDKRFGSLIDTENHETGSSVENNADTFVNGTVSSNKIRIDKALTDDTIHTDEDFTFTLASVFKQDVTISGDSVEIQKETPLDSVSFEVYDRETNKLIRTGTTTEEGTFTLKAGEYAIFPAEEELYYHVTEMDGTDSDFSFASTDGQNYIPLDHGGLINAKPGAGHILTLHYMDGTGKVTRETINSNTTLPDEEEMKSQKATLGFAGWYTDEACTQKYEGDVTQENGDLELYAGWKNATFARGRIVNIAMKRLAGHTDAQKISVEDENIKAIKWADELPDSSVEKKNVAAEDSIPIWMWYKDGTIYYHSAAREPYLNRNSSVMIVYLEGLTDISGLSRWHAERAEDMSATFAVCTSLKDVNALKDWDVSNVTDMTQIFYYCDILEDFSGLKNWDTSSVTTLDTAFCDCHRMDSADLYDIAGWDVSNVENMQMTFNRCVMLTDLDALSSWDTSSVTDMNRMFMGWYAYYFGGMKLNDTSGIKNWDVSKVKNMCAMFADDSKLQTVDLSGWNLDSASPSDRVTDEVGTHSPFYRMFESVGTSSDTPVTVTCKQKTKDKLKNGSSWLGSYVAWEIVE